MRYKFDLFAVRCPALLHQILRCAPLTFLVILNIAVGGVKDLKHHTGLYFGFPHQILRCAQNDSKLRFRMTVS